MQGQVTSGGSKVLENEVAAKNATVIDRINLAGGIYLGKNNLHEFAYGATAYHFGTWGARGSRLRYAVHAHCAEGMLELDHVAGTI